MNTSMWGYGLAGGKAGPGPKKPLRGKRPSSVDRSQHATVFVIEDHEGEQILLRRLLESVGYSVEVYSTAEEFLHQYDPERPGCIVLDIRLPGMSGLELQEKLNGGDLRPPIIFLTGFGDVPMTVRALKAGCTEFIQKPINEQVFLESVRHAIEMDENKRCDQQEFVEIKKRLQQLTRRENEILRYVVQGLSNKEISKQCDVSFRTVEVHRANVMRKMQAKSVAELVRMVVNVIDS